MSVEAELLTIADRMASIQQRFVQSRSEMFLKSEDQAEFRGLAVEAKAILDGALGHANDFSMNLIHAVNSGSGGFFGGPSYACVGEAVVLVRSAVRQRSRSESSKCCGHGMRNTPKNRLEFALTRPTRKSDALLLAAQPER